MTFREDFAKGMEAVKGRAYSDGTRVFRVRDSFLDFLASKKSVSVESYIMSGSREGTYERRRLNLSEIGDSKPATKDEIALLDGQVQIYKSISPEELKRRIKPLEGKKSKDLDRLMKGYEEMDQEK